jgi:hypothetical protein
MKKGQAPRKQDNKQNKEAMKRLLNIHSRRKNESPQRITFQK